MTAGEIKGPDDPDEVARAVCLQLLASRARTHDELAAALRRRGVPDDAAGRVLDRFTAVGLIDDASYAEEWVRSRHEVRGLGRRALAAELRRKGVADQTVADALGGIDRPAEQRRARALVEQRLRSAARRAAGIDEATARRLVGMLARKGYPAGLAYEVVRDALAAHQDSLAPGVAEALTEHAAHPPDD